MTPRRRRRLILVLCVLVGASATVALTVAAFRQNLLFFYTPTQILKELTFSKRPVRLGGLVVDNSIVRETGDLEVRFAVTDTINAVTVSYSGVLPDLFREGQGVVVRGVWQAGVLVADEVLAKHDENYMPPEAHDALKAAGSLQQ
ncbi:cytochrome c maturation protein CcmE [Candidatus Persebacteraceae bacterium Df01]|jgi:cytochrome c-type biogenesis protein CcmE|uniref:Cytochrome c-type biogenesis protein CcmE n=1 Tax=Candidatus Doriopsillibacter californiensis TaxID=2970740 RepID=A0ABT7QM06_9GAMM|nr:cytochrome c maturation protein CcmE [Candidatus Persebacteraceae bacterium Df01]